MTNEQRELKKQQQENAKVQKELNLLKRKEELETEKLRCRKDALSKAVFLDYPEKSKTSESVLREADKLYKWLIKDLK